MRHFGAESELAAAEKYPIPVVLKVPKSSRRGLDCLNLTVEALTDRIAYPMTKVTH